MNKRDYKCGMCGRTVVFYAGFRMLCKGWDRHVFSMTGENDEEKNHG